MVAVLVRGTHRRCPRRARYVTNLFDGQYISFGVYAQNAKAPVGTPAPADPNEPWSKGCLTARQPRAARVEPLDTDWNGRREL
jgi:hypothetical protein